MIQMHIGTQSEQQAIEIIDFLEDDKLIVDALIIETQKRSRTNGISQHSTYYMILGKTKALLFNTIDDALRSKYPDNLPSIYSTPIVNMDWDETKDLREKTAKV